MYGHTGVYIVENIALKIIKSRRKPLAVDFRSNLGIDQTHFVRLYKEQSVLSAIVNFYPDKKIKLQFKFLSFEIDIHFFEHNLGVELMN